MKIIEFYKQKIEKRKHGRIYARKPSKAIKSIGVKDGWFFAEKWFTVNQYIKYGTIRKMSVVSFNMDCPFSVVVFNS